MSAKKGQKFQNKSAFKVKYDTCSLEVTKKASLDRLCKRCLEQIQWKIQFNKYKPAKVPSRCHRCGEKNIIKAYRKCCDVCSDELQICTKCEQSKHLEPKPAPPEKEDEKKNNNGIDKKLLGEMEGYLETLRERSRRVIIRKIKQDLLTWKDGQFIYKETGKTLENLKFKNLDDLDDLEGSSDDDKENEKASKIKNSKKIVKKAENQELDDEFEDISDQDDEEEEKD